MIPCGTRNRLVPGLEGEWPAIAAGERGKATAKILIAALIEKPVSACWVHQMSLLQHHPPFSSLLCAPPSSQSHSLILTTMLPCRPLSRSMRASLPLHEHDLGPICGCATSDFAISESAPPTSSRVFIKGLSRSTSEGFLAKTFSSFGEVRRVKVITSKRAKQSLGLAYVWFANEQDALMAVKEMDGKFFDGRFIAVKIAEGESPSKQEVPCDLCTRLPDHLFPQRLLAAAAASVPSPDEELGGVDPVQLPPNPAEPSDLLHLAAGQPASIRLDLVDGGLQQPRLSLLPHPRLLRSEVPVQLRHADRPPNPPRVVPVRPERCPRLLHQPLLHHSFHPLRHELLQRRRLHVHPQEAVLVLRPEGAAVSLHQLLNVGVGPAGYDRNPPAGEDLSNRAHGGAAEVRRREVRVRLDAAEEVVRDAAALRHRDLVGDHVQAVVDLHLVGVDDLAAEARGQGYGELGLSAASCAKDEDDLVLGSREVGGGLVGERCRHF